LIFYVGFMMAGWTARKQCLHDLMAGTCVVRRDGLVAFERGDLPGTTTTPIAGSGMPGWAVALIVIGACFFVIIPILAILAAIAIPAYQDYVIRAQIDQGLALADGAKTAVSEYIAGHGTLPDGNAAVGLSEPEAIHGKYVAGVEVRGGQIIVTYGNHANALIRDGHVVFAPHGSASLLHWACSSPDIKPQYLPPRCRE
jgi:Pilin (bacterial filament)